MLNLLVFKGISSPALFTEDVWAVSRLESSQQLKAGLVKSRASPFLRVWFLLV